MIEGPRACRPEEFDETLALINSVFRAGSDQDIRTDYPLIFNDRGLRYMRILRVSGQVVAHVPVAPRKIIAGGDTFTAGIISPTVTHPDHRRRGYATRCLRDCVRIMKERGWPVSVLWTLPATFPFYHQSGWEAVANQGWVYALAPGDEALFERGEFETVPFDPGREEHLDAVIRFHDAEPWRVARDREDYAALLTLPKISTRLALAGGEVAGYLCVGSGRNKPGLNEAGGSAEAVEALAAEAVKAHAPVQAVTRLKPTVLGDLLADRVGSTRQEIERGSGVGSQMIRINSLELLLRSIEGHLRSCSDGVSGAVSLECTDTGERVTLGFGGGEVRFDADPAAERVVLTERQMVQLVFGGHSSCEPLDLPARAADLLEQVFPYNFPIWELDRS